MKKYLFLIIVVAFVFKSNSQVKILFNTTKAEQAGNADWVIDADSYNIYFSMTTHMPYVGTGSTGASNAQRFPTPAQSGITASSPETYWTGGISALAVDMAKLGYQVESLPVNVPITFSNSTNVQDLSNYKIYVVCEPNIPFTASEKAAIINFVKNGGSLFMVSDHRVSDRNNDGWDSPQIWTDLMNNNSVQNYPFGMTFDTSATTGNFSGTYTFMSPNTQDSLTHGPGGTCTQVKWSGGTRISINTSQNSTVVGDVFKTSNTSSTTDILVAHARFFKGKVAAIADSSPLDDGTGDPNDILYTGYMVDAAGNHQKLLINTMVWLAQGGTVTGITENSQNDYSVVLFPNPSNGLVNLMSKESIKSVEIISYLGQKIDATVIDSKIDTKDLNTGCYIFRIITEKGVINKTFIKTN